MALTQRQQNLLEYMIANPTLAETRCAKDCGIANSTYFDWKKKGEFTAELNRRIKEKWADSERLATEQMIALCAKGDYAATKYILDNLGYKPVDRLQAEVKNDINIVIEE